MGRRPKDNPLHLTTWEMRLINLYAEKDGWLHGYDARDQLSGKKPANPTLYRVLNALHERGMLDCRWEQAQKACKRKTPRRRLYKINDLGRQALAARRKR